ncbi:MAG: YceD family protein [Acidimicrobiia bacterium]
MSNESAHQLIIKADDLVGHPEKQRPFHEELEVTLRVVDSTVDGPLVVSGVTRGTVDGVQASFDVSAEVTMRCARCLIEWTESMDVAGSQHFSKVPDDDGYGIVNGTIDVGSPSVDEFALALKAAPVHDPACLGLCPTCGANLNDDPCDGHPEESDSPFAALGDLFDS